MRSKRKNGGGKKSKNGSGSGKGGDSPHDHVIEFTPEGGFNIRTAAHHFAQLMETSGQALVIHLPHVSVEFESGCTPREIIDGYNQAMRAKFVVKPSNANVKGAPK
jgi:hypothetical protein